MNEVLPGVHHWTARHEGIGMDVSSYYVASAQALIDPMLPDGGLDAFDGLPEPAVILLTNRHHYRHSEAFGCRVRCHESGLHEFTSGEQVEGFAWGDEVAPGIVALELGTICPDDAVLAIPGSGVLAFADSIVQYGGIRFVPDHLIGDDPESVKQATRERVRELLDEQEFDALLFAHGEPIPTGGRDALRAFAESES